MATTETQLVTAMARAIEARYPGAWTFKVHGSPYQRVGVPDLLVCVRGRFIAIEAKHRKPGESEEHARGRATPVQRAQLRALAEAGASAGVAITVEEALALVARGLVL